MTDYVSLRLARGVAATLTFAAGAAALVVSDSPGGPTRLTKPASPGPEGRSAFALTPDETARLSPGEYAVEVWDRRGPRAPLAAGILTLTEE